MSAKTKLHFARFEFKYLLPKELRAELERELRYFVDFDPFVAEREGHKYFVRSLYFDDPHYSAFYDKVDGLHSRSKFRIRTYTNQSEDGTPQFLEIKGRHNNLVLKHRALIADEGKVRQERGDELSSQICRSVPDCDVARQFTYELFRKRLRPVALVDYQRRPYVSRFDPDFRLTFDSELSAVRTRGLFPSPSDRRREMFPGGTVMEVKFRHHIPSWFHRLIQAYELRRVSVSKICQAMETLEICEDPN